MSLKQYLANVEKTFKFRIKTLFPLVDETMDLLEKALLKYRPKSITDPVKTMYQTNPLGFTGVKYGEVFMTDVELTVPVTAHILELDLRSMLGLGSSDANLRVFSENDLAQQGIADAEKEEEDSEKKPALLTQEHFEEVEEAVFTDFYGDDYNKKFTAYLKQVEIERKEKAKAGPVDSLHPITRWEKQPKLEPKAEDTEPKVD